MADRTRRDLGSDVADLRRILGTIRRELQPGDTRRLRPPTIAEVRRFTTEVTIPAAILVLETNIRALELLQRALRRSEDGEGSGAAGEVPRRAAAVSRETLSRLDDALVELQEAVAGRPGDENLARLLEEARDLQDRVEAQLADGAPGAAATDVGDTHEDTVEIDVEAELESIKEDIDSDDRE